MMGPTVKASRIAIERGSDGYPPGVLDLSNAPKRLYMLGNPEALQGPAIAIVGTRRPTPYGIALTELAAELAVEAGITVVSGGAIGCDQAAGMKALACGGVHVVVLGCGADVIYPSSSRGLIDKTLEAGGAVVSIAPWGTKPQRFLFPQRNQRSRRRCSLERLACLPVPSAPQRRLWSLAGKCLLRPGRFSLPNLAAQTISSVSARAALPMRSRSKSRCHAFSACSGIRMSLSAKWSLPTRASCVLWPQARCAQRI